MAENQSRRGGVLVTGATSGIGAAVALDLAADFDVIAVGRSKAKLQELTGVAGITPISADLTGADELSRLVDSLPGELAGLVHSAAIGTPGRPDESGADEWRRQFELNVTAAAELTRLSLPALRRVGGTVVLINSGAGLRAGADMTVYAATKHALKAYADSLRAAEGGIVRVATVYPGRTATPMQVELKQYEGAEYRPEDLLRPTTVAAAVRFCLMAPSDAQITDVQIRPRYEAR